MTAAAAFPIASLIPGGQKVQTQSDASTASSTRATAGSAAISFRAGMEALVSAGQTHASDAASSEALKDQLKDQFEDHFKDQLADAGTGVESDTKSGFLNETASLPRALQTPQASVPPGLAKTDPAETGPAKSDSAASMRLQAVRQPISESPALPASIAARATAGATAGKSSESERPAQTKPARDSEKTSAQTGLPSNQGFAPAPVHVSNLNLPAAPPPQHTQTIHAGVESGSTSATRASYTSSALSASIGTESESQGKDLSGALTVEESVRATNRVSSANAQTSHAAAASTAATAQSAPRRADASAQSPADDPAPQSQIKSASEQSLSGNATNALPSTEPGTVAEQTRAASSHAAATREHDSLQHPIAGDAALQSPAVASHTMSSRDAAGISGLPAERGSSTTGTAQQAASNSPTARDTFAALDADPGQPATTWTHTGPRQVEAGYQDPSLGWVSVRADLSSGGLHASVVPNSPEAAQALGNHLAGLNAYLAEHHGSSITASLAAPEDRSMQQSGNSGAQPGAHQQDRSSQSSADQASGQTSISSALHTGSSEPEVYTPTHNGRISVLA